jgi:hypothetical protein
LKLVACVRDVVPRTSLTLWCVPWQFLACLTLNGEFLQIYRYVSMYHETVLAQAIMLVTCLFSYVLYNASRRRPT